MSRDTYQFWQVHLSLWIIHPSPNVSTSAGFNFVAIGQKCETTIVKWKWPKELLYMSQSQGKCLKEYRAACFKCQGILSLLKQSKVHGRLMCSGNSYVVESLDRQIRDWKKLQDSSHCWNTHILQLWLDSPQLSINSWCTLQSCFIILEVWWIL